jgi:CheY-like chemotaxis protein
MDILLIDDSKEDRELIINLIKKSEADVKIEESVCLTDGIEKIVKKNYDAIILDLILPETDGLTTIIETKNAMERSSRCIPIIVLTGYEDYTTGREAFSMGVTDFLIKGEIGVKEISRAINFIKYNKSNKYLHSLSNR